MKLKIETETEICSFTCYIDCIIVLMTFIVWNPNRYWTKLQRSLKDDQRRRFR